MKHFSFLIVLLLWVSATASHGQAPAWQQAISIAQTSASTVTLTATGADGAGNVYVAGNFTGTLTLGSTSLTAVVGTSASTTDVFVAKWNQRNAVWTWAVQAGGSDIDQARDLVVSNGSVYLAGSFRSPTLSLGALMLTNAGIVGQRTLDVFVAKLNDNGASATWAWAQQAGGPDSDILSGLAVSGSSVYVAGQFASPNAVFGATVLANANPTGTGSFDAFVAKLTDAGTSASFAWAQRAGGTSGDVANAVAVGAGGAVYFTGTFVGIAGFGATTLSSNGFFNDVFVAKLVDAGSSANWAWVQQAGGPGNDAVSDLAVAGTNVYATGTFLGASTSFGPTTLVQTGGGSSTATIGDVFVTKLADAGPTSSFAWAVKAGGSGYDVPTALVVNGPRLYVAGMFDSPTADFGSITLANAGTGSLISDIFVAKLVDAGSSADFAWVQQAGGSRNDQAATLAVGGTGLIVAGFATLPANFGSLALPGISGTQVGYFASFTDPTLTATTAARGGLSFSLAPNPARTTATVQLPAVAGAATATLTLMNALGRTLRTQTAPTNTRIELDLRGLAPGLYLVQVSAGSTRSTQRLVVE